MAKWMDEPMNEWMNESVVIWKILEYQILEHYFPNYFQPDCCNKYSNCNFFMTLFQVQFLVILKL